MCYFCETGRTPDLRIGCYACGGSLVAIVDGELPDDARTFWDYAPVLPVDAERISISEGNTPLLRLERVSAARAL